MIAILGATGTIGRSVARVLARDRQRRLVLFARDPSPLADQPWSTNVSLRGLDRFVAGDFQLVINAIGAGDPARVRTIGADIFDITQTWDQRVLMTMSADTRYVFLSSGAVYGTELTEPVRPDSRISLPVNHLASVPPYTIAKLYAEARHRFAPHRSILDVRVFGYADVTLPLEGSFFLSDLARSIITRRPLVTSADDMVRDYAGAEELVALIQYWEAAAAPNTPLDLYTKAPVSKLELLDIVQSRFGVEVDTRGGIEGSPTGTKPVYASQNYAAAALGYSPRRTAAEIVVEFLDAVSSAHNLDIARR